MTIVDTNTESEYNPANFESELDDLKDEMQSAFASGDAERIAKAEEKITAFSMKGVAPIEAPAPQEGIPVPNQPGEVPAEGQNTSESGESNASGTEVTSAKDGAPNSSEPTPKESPSPTDDWLNSLDPAIRAQVERKLVEAQQAKEYHEQFVRSQQGRLQAFQRKAEEAEAKRKELEARLKNDGAAPAQQPATQPTANRAKIEELTAKINRVKSTDPELADLLETTRDALIQVEESTKALQAQPTSNRDLEELKQAFERQRQEQIVEMERQRLNSLVPQATEILDYMYYTPVANRPFNTKDSAGRPAWSPWVEFVNQLPPALQQAADDANADTYAYLLRDLYTPWAQRYNAAHGFTQQTPQDNTTPAVSTPASDPRAAAVAASRQAKVVTTAASPAKSTPPPTKEVSFEELLRNPPANMTPDQYEELKDKATRYFLEQNTKRK